MARGSIKNKILETERRLAVEVRECLAEWRYADESWRDGTREVIALWVTRLLSLHVQLDHSWPQDRWLDGIDIKSLVVSDEEKTLRAEGVLWWGLRSDAGGKQTDEPFTGAIWLAESKRRPLSYELRFGQGTASRSFIIFRGSRLF